MNSEKKRMAEGMGSRLRAVRLAMGYDTVAGFARYLDIPASTVRRCERGKLIATHRAIPLGHALCDRAGFTFDWFFMGTPQGKRPRRGSAA